MLDSIHDRQLFGLLDSLDELRRANLSTNIDAPHIVVCAERSTNTDGLLETITEVQFPALRNYLQCAVEVVLRYAPNPWLYARIPPAPHRSALERKHLEQFRYHSFATSIRETFALFQLAKDKLDKLQTVSGYWHEVLRVEIYGPSQLPPTLTVSTP